MEEKDLNLENVNSIDMSINPAFLDDDDSFGSLTVKDEDYADDRNFERNTGIIIDLSDGDIETPKIISADIDLNSSDINISKNFSSTAIDADPANFNSIDMETEYFDEDDIELVAKNASDKKSKAAPKNPLFFEAEETEDVFIDEKLEDGAVDNDYWKNITKKHNKSVKKGAYNTHFHLSGNPKADMEFFNDSMSLRSNTASFPEVTDSAVDSNITGVAASEGSFCESVEAKMNYKKFFQEILDIIGVDVIKNSDNTFTVIDFCSDNSEHSCADMNEVKVTLQPYIEDCFIYPLQIATNQKLATCKDWCNWYASEDNQKAFPNCAEDIKYCDVIANHLEECQIGD